MEEKNLRRLEEWFKETFSRRVALGFDDGKVWLKSVDDSQYHAYAPRVIGSTEEEARKTLVALAFEWTDQEQEAGERAMETDQN